MKKIAALLCLVCFIMPMLNAEQMKDISDPVLQEIINSFSPRMPRFIEKHGKNLFIADEPLTRGSLMYAIYEYDKSIKPLKKDYVLKQEFDEFKSNVIQMNKNAKPDMTQVINDLQPNMPLLLDNSLENSKVFNKLKESVAGGKSGDLSAESKNDIEYLKMQIAELTKKIEKLEKQNKNDENQPSNKNWVMKSDFEGTKVQLAGLVKRVEVVEQRPFLKDSESSKKEFSEDRNKLFLNVSETNMQLKSSMTDILKRIEKLEKQPSQYKTTSSSEVPEFVLKKMSETRDDVAKLKKTVSEIQDNNVNINLKSESRSSSSLLTKISFGLSMAAALFIAR